MSAQRTDDERRQARRVLFDRFPREGDAGQVLDFQRLLVRELVASEEEKRAGGGHAISDHLHAVRHYGDSLAFSHLSRHAIRQLSRNDGKPANISGQGESFELTMLVCERLCETGVALVVDATNVLANGDVVLCLDPDAPEIVECKMGNVRDAFKRQGRRGRQIARMERIHEFLETGRGTFFGESRERRTLELQLEPVYDYRPVREVVEAALEKGRGMKVMADQIYIATVAGNKPSFEEVDPSWPAGSPVVVGSTSEMLAHDRSDVMPPLLWDVPDPVRWALMEGDVALSQVARVAALAGDVDGVGISYTMDTAAHLSDPTANTAGWGFLYLVNLGPSPDAKPIVLSPHCLRDVVYCHETVASARARLVEMAVEGRKMFNRGR